MAHQAGEQPELGRRKVHGRSRPVDRPSSLVEDDVAAAEHAAGAWSGAGRIGGHRPAHPR
jgi:hypothetical protein